MEESSSFTHYKNDFKQSYLAFFLKSLLQPRDFEKAELILETEIRRYSEKLLLKSSEMISKREVDQLRKKLEIYKTMFHELSVEFDEYEMESVATKDALTSKLKRAQKRITYLEKKLDEKSTEKHQMDKDSELTTGILEKGETECLKEMKLEKELEVCRTKCRELSTEVEEKKLKCVAFADKLEAVLLRKSSVDDKLQGYVKLCNGLKERLSCLEDNVESTRERENAAREKITIFSEEIKSITRDEGEEYAHLKENVTDLECVKPPAEDDIEVECPELESRESRVPSKLQLAQVKSKERLLNRCDKITFFAYESSIHQPWAKENRNVFVPDPPSVDIQVRPLVKVEEVSKTSPSESKVEPNEAIIEISDDSSIICWDSNRVNEDYGSSYDEDCPCSSKHKRKWASEIVGSENECESEIQDEPKLKKHRELKDDVPKSSPEKGKNNVMKEDYLINSGECLGGSNVEKSCSSDTSRKSEDAENNSLDFSQAMLMGYKSKDEQKTNWKLEAEMVSSFEEDPKLCLKAVCALYHQQTSDGELMEDSLGNCYLGFNKIDTLRGTALAEFLTDGDREGNVMKSIEELELFDPKALEDCKRIAQTYSSQLFTIYQTKKDGFFFPS